MTTRSDSPIERIRERAVELSPKQRILARYVEKNPLKAACMTSTVLAQNAEVSESTVIRFAMALGYPGYPEFQTALQERMHSRISSLERFSLDGAGAGAEEPLYRKVFRLESSLLASAEEALSPKAFEEALERLATARKVIVIGGHPNSCVAEYAAFFLGTLRPNVQVITDLNVKSYTELQDVGAEDVVLAFSFPRYPSSANEIVEFLRRQDVPVIAVTDSSLSPLAPLADLLLLTPMKFITFVDPLAAPMALVHALLIGLFLRDPERSRHQVQIFEDFWKENRLFLRKDMDIIGLL